MNEWSLLIFTFMMNATIGLALTTGLFARRLSHYLNAESYYRFMLLALFVICGLAGLGSIASITHLGVPLNAPNAIRNVFSAWLSREVVVTAIFVGCLGLTFLWLWRTRKLSMLLLSASILIGLFDIYCMASIYRHTSILTWMDPNTYVMFFGAMLTLGVAIFFLLIKVLQRIGSKLGIEIPQGSFPIRWKWQLWGIMTFSLIGRLLYQPFYEQYLTSTLYSQKSVTFPLSPIQVYYSIGSLRTTCWILATFAVLACGYSLVKFLAPKNQSKSTESIFSLGCVIAIIADFMLRYVFYSIH
ncbi:dimethyl sulfoxide reductase anchor subunit [Proteus cibarius]|uniref:Dimethyl sulfoxide reductase anchor subunit n=1 Tax=Proteus terrae subsp. cibarius TaxID=626774 RepID=A0A8I0WNY9_9GAMM|nr:MULTISPECIES: DmsC/YnfH family molybdoenzyme membrane anchor subunit [Proteus]QHP78169.1 reductase [Proteus vulgaris]MBG2913883.1 dimethyl sulfoxide reductase anchor subunit [Proteus terrae subsp. cibarius]MBG6038789.1 dimethyl sulfoxide reductase anchor subunit [Proteus terrae subsp. cibarius]MCM2368407.1 dimethyl sulfoxide reductase anchor subunit [Proteus sp. FZP2095]QHD94003.1 dimethyl sulfoxide reductase anchor subunit [Proteus terrae subsp. cibarius]